MLNLNQAIELATKAHEGQWRKPSNASITDFESKRKEILKSGGSYILKNGSHLYEDKDDKHIWKIRKPYITHPLAVMEMMDTEEEKTVAVLHDIIEDTEATLYPHDGLFIKYKDLKYELTKKVYVALHSITKFECDGKTYKQHISDVSKNKLATKVKIADIVCNLADNPSEHAKQKYLKALPILLKGIQNENN